MKVSKYVYYCAELDKLLESDELFSGFYLRTGWEYEYYIYVYIGEL